MNVKLTSFFYFLFFRLSVDILGKQHNSDLINDPLGSDFGTCLCNWRPNLFFFSLIAQHENVSFYVEARRDTMVPGNTVFPLRNAIILLKV